MHLPQPILCFFRTQTSSPGVLPSKASFPGRSSTSHVLNLYAPRSPMPEKRSNDQPCFGHVTPALSTMPKSSMSNGVPLDSGNDECGHFLSTKSVPHSPLAPFSKRLPVTYMVYGMELPPVPKHKHLVL